MSKENKEKDPKKASSWKPDPDITMTIKKGDLWKPDKSLKMKFQETVEKKRKQKKI